MLCQLINISHSLRNALLISILTFLAPVCPALGAQTGDSTTIEFLGRLIKTTVCKLNNDKPIVVDMGNVGIMKVSNGKYIKDIDYTLECSNTSATSVVDMTLLGVVENWDTTLLASNIPGLGAKILLNGNPLGLEKPVDIAVGSTPKLQVQLVVQPGVTLKEVPFTITGTLLVSYK